MVLLAGWVIHQIVLKSGKSEKYANRALLIWLINPITLYSAVIMGQNDILAMFPFVLGLMYFYDRPWVAFLLFGLAGSIKSYPLIWALMLAFTYPKINYSKKIMLAFVPIICYVIPMLPFLKFQYFKESVINSGLAMRMFEGVIDIGFGDKLLIVPTILIALLLIAAKNKLSLKLESLVMMLMTSTLVILGFTHFHPQWFIWMMPFVAIYMSDKDDWWWLAMIFVALLGIIFLFDDKYLYWGLMSPMNNGLINLPYLSEILVAAGVDVQMLNNLCHSVIAGVGIYWVNVCNTNEK